MRCKSNKIKRNWVRFEIHMALRQVQVGRSQSLEHGGAQVLGVHVGQRALAEKS